MVASGNPTIALAVYICATGETKPENIIKIRIVMGIVLPPRAL